MENTLVSIITPAYNSSKFIEETIKSVLNQTYNNWELLITDDFSTDNTIEIIESYAENDSRIKLFKLEKNSGAAIARNNSILNSKGRFIAFLDSDDLWIHNKLELQIRFMINNKYSFSHTSYIEYNLNNNSSKIINSVNRINYSMMLRNCYVGCLTVVYDSYKIGKIYMPTIRKRQDYALWLKILKLTDYCYGLDLVLSKYNITGNSLSSSKLNLTLSFRTSIKSTAKCKDKLLLSYSDILSKNSFIFLIHILFLRYFIFLNYLRKKYLCYIIKWVF